jgi:hypothetical protein
MILMILYLPRSDYTSTDKNNNNMIELIMFYMFQFICSKYCMLCYGVLFIYWGYIQNRALRSMTRQATKTRWMQDSLSSARKHNWPVHLLGRQLAFMSKARCLRVSKTESYGLSRICFEMTRQATKTHVRQAVLGSNHVDISAVSKL